MDRVVTAVETNAMVMSEVADSCKTGDDRGTKWLSPAWTFARELCETPELMDLDADDAADRIEPALNSAGLDWSALGIEDSYGHEINPLDDFLRVWEAVRPSALKRALRRVGEPAEDAFGPKLTAPRRAKYRRFLAVARELCRVAENGVAPLAVYPIADLLDTDRRTVGGWRGEAERQGWLEKCSEAKRPGAGGRAATYRWTGPGA